MAEPLVILGSGPHAREMAEIVERINAVRPTWNLLGFVSEHTRDAGQTWGGHQVLGTLGVLSSLPDARVVPVSEWWQLDCLPRERFASLVDPSCFVSRTATVGRGCVVFPHGYLGDGTTLGDFVFCLSGCVVNHDAVLEERVMLTSGVVLAGDVRVESGAYLGQSCSVRQRVRVGKRSIVGMGSVVIEDVPERSVVIGNPARLAGSVSTRHRGGAGMGSGEFRRLQGVEGKQGRLRFR